MFGLTESKEKVAGNGWGWTLCAVGLLGVLALKYFENQEAAGADIRGSDNGYNFGEPAQHFSGASYLVDTMNVGGAIEGASFYEVRS